MTALPGAVPSSDEGDGLLTLAQAQSINTIGIAVAGVSLLTSFATCAVALYYFRSARYRPLFSAFPTRMLYLALILSIPFSVFWLLSCVRGASAVEPLCQLDMWGIVFFWHMVNGLLFVVLVDCAAVIFKGYSIVQRRGKVMTACLVVIALVLSLTGIWLDRYGYIENLDTCWFRYPTSAPDASNDLRAFRFEMIVLLGPTYAFLLLEIGFFFVILWKLLRSATLKKRKMTSMEDGYSNGSLEGGLAKTTSHINRLILRLSASPFLLFLHSLMIIGADLPIQYEHASAQYASYFFGTFGFASLGLLLSFCALFVDIALSRAIMLTWSKPPASFET